MSMSFQSGAGGVEFSQLGMTSTVSGITTTVTLYNTSGGTTPTSFTPPLNYILGPYLNFVADGAGFQDVTGGILSLTTQSSRIVEISLSAGATVPGGQVEVAIPAGVGLGDASINLRVLRGPSTVIGANNFYLGATGQIVTTYRLPASAFLFRDFSPLSGAATYILQINPGGASFSATIARTQLFVRQI